MKMVRSRENLIGAWVFLIGVVLAVIAGLFQEVLGLSTSNVIYILLVVMGFIIGIANVGDKDSITFLIAALTLIIVSGLGQTPLTFISNLSPILSSMINILTALLVMMIPATVIVALKTVFSVARV